MGELAHRGADRAPAYHTVFGRRFWEDLAAHPEVSASFDALMGPSGHGIPDPEVLVSGGWESVRTVVDVGGGTGSLLAEILRKRPTLRGTLVDLPATVARSAEVFHAAGVADRVTALGQSFFEPLPAGADLYLLKNVLGDWPDREALVILTRLRGGGAGWRSGRHSRRSFGRREPGAGSGAVDDGSCRWEESKPCGVSRAGAGGRAGGDGHGPAADRAVCG